MGLLLLSANWFTTLVAQSLPSITQTFMQLQITWQPDSAMYMDTMEREKLKLILNKFNIGTELLLLSITQTLSQLIITWQQNMATDLDILERGKLRLIPNFLFMLFLMLIFIHL